jgi:membrane-associated phospholipid phosphatase
MPSSHCAAALVAIWYLARQYRWATVPLSAELLLLCLSTVYGRYHYVLDVFAGLLIGAMSITLATKWQRRFRVRSPEFVDLAESKAQEAVRVSVPD